MLISRRNNLFDDFFNDPFFSDSNQNRQSLMRTDIQDDGANYVLETELPGYKKDQVRAELKDGYLTIYAERSSDTEDADEKKNFVRKERFSGSCKRSFYVGSQLRQEDIKAAFENGVLKLVVPKEAPKQAEENHYITIE